MSYYRYPKTMNERKQYYKEPALVRPKRRPRMLPDGWEWDIYHYTPKTWKDQSKKRRQHSYNQKEITDFKKQFFYQELTDKSLLL